MGRPRKETKEIVRKNKSGERVIYKYPADKEKEKATAFYDLIVLATGSYFATYEHNKNDSLEKIAKDGEEVYKKQMKRLGIKEFVALPFPYYEKNTLIY